MLYQKEIDDSVLIQFIILFTLDNVDRPVAYDDLLNLVLNNCNINYNDFQIALDNLANTEHIQTFLEGDHKQIYAITQKGSNAGGFFKSQIPIYIREPIKDSIKELFRNERLKNSIRSGITPVRKNERAHRACRRTGSGRSKNRGLHCSGQENRGAIPRAEELNFHCPILSAI